MNEPALEPGYDADTFSVVPIVISHYNSHSNLPTADTEAERVAAILSRWGGELVPWDVEGPKRSLDTALARLKSWSQPAASRNSLLLWISHGWSNDDDAQVYLPADNTDFGLGPVELAKCVVDEHRMRDEQDWAIVVVEACGGVRFAEMMEAHLATQRVRNGLLLVGSGADRGVGYLGNFRRALEQICEAYWSNDKLISLRDLANRFEDVLDPGFVRAVGLSGRSMLRPRRDLAPSLTTPVDSYPDVRDVLMALPEAELLQLARNGLGSDLLEIGGHFVGRVAERSAVATWMESHRSGMLVITGGPGSGKSALLANLMMHAVPSLRLALEHAPHLGDGWAGQHDLPPVDGALLLTGAAISDVVGRLARVAEVDLPTGLPPSEQASALVRMLAERQVCLTLFVDALDEARDPAAIAELLGRLAELDEVRIVLATRARSDVDGDVILERLRSHSRDLTVMPLHDDRVAALEFAVARLRSAGQRVSERDLEEVVAELTERLADHVDADAHWDFLHVRMLATELIATPSLLTSAFATERAQLMSLNRDALFLRAMQRLAVVNKHAESLLLALACGQGRGLPRADRIWATVAGALNPGHVFTEADVSQVLRTAGPYIMLDAEDGRSVFRLAHRTFTDQLRARLDPQNQAAVLAALIQLTREAPDPAPYLSCHLSGHAASLGREGWAALGLEAGVLDRLDLTALVADSWRSPADDLPLSVLAVRRTAHLALTGAEGDRCGYRQLGVALEAGHYSPTLAPVNGAAWQVTAACLVRDTSLQTDSVGAPVPVRSLAVCTIEDGTDVVAYGDDHGRIRVWNPWNGRTADLVPDALRGGEILGLAALDSATGLRLASVGSGRPARLWPLPEGLEPFELPERFGGIPCVVSAFRTDEGGLALAVGTLNGRIWLLDPSQVDEYRSWRRLSGHAKRITGMATIRGAAGRRELLSVSVDGSLRRWNLQHGQRAKCVDWHKPLLAIAVAEQSGLILTGDSEGVVTVWTGQDLERSRNFPAHMGAVNSLALLSDNPGRILAASGGADRRVRLWDMAEDVPQGLDLTGHDDEVTALATLRSPDGAPIVASGSRDGSVKIWTTATTQSTATAPPIRRSSRREPPQRWAFVTTGDRSVTLTRTPSGQISCQVEDGAAVFLPAAANRARCAAIIPHEATVTVATSNSSTIHTWCARTGVAAGPPLKGHKDWVRALLTLQLEGGFSVLVSGGDDGRVCMWDPVSGQLRQRIDLGSSIKSLNHSNDTRRFDVVLDQGHIEIEVKDSVLRGIHDWKYYE